MQPIFVGYPKAEAEEWAALEARRKEETAERAAAYRSDLGKQVCAEGSANAWKRFGNSVCVT